MNDDEVNDEVNPNQGATNMATLNVCDCCKKVLPKWPGPNVPPACADEDGRVRRVRLEHGTVYQHWDLCDDCYGKVRAALAPLGIEVDGRLAALAVNWRIPIGAEGQAGWERSEKGYKG